MFDVKRLEVPTWNGLERLRNRFAVLASVQRKRDEIGNQNMCKLAINRTVKCVRTRDYAVWLGRRKRMTVKLTGPNQFVGIKMPEVSIGCAKSPRENLIVFLRSLAFFEQPLTI